MKKFFLLLFLIIPFCVKAGGYYPLSNTITAVDENGKLLSGGIFGIFDINGNLLYTFEDNGDGTYFGEITDSDLFIPLIPKEYMDIFESINSIDDVAKYYPVGKDVFFTDGQLRSYNQFYLPVIFKTIKAPTGFYGIQEHIVFMSVNFNFYDADEVNSFSKNIYINFAGNNSDEFIDIYYDFPKDVELKPFYTYEETEPFLEHDYNGSNTTFLYYSKPAVLGVSIKIDSKKEVKLEENFKSLVEVTVENKSDYNSDAVTIKHILPRKAKPIESSISDDGIYDETNNCIVWEVEYIKDLSSRSFSYYLDTEDLINDTYIFDVKAQMGEDILEDSANLVYAVKKKIIANPDTTAKDYLIYALVSIILLFYSIKKYKKTA